MSGPQNGDGAGGSSAPPPNIDVPEDLNAAIQILPTNQLPYGPNCLIDRRIQAVLFHYGVSVPVVAKLDEEEFRKMTEFRLASPGLDSGMWEFVESFCPNALQKHKLKLAFRRLLADDPMCAISVKRPSSFSSAGKAKKAKVSSAPAAKVVSALLYEDISSSELSDIGEAEEKGDGDSEKKPGSNSCLSKSLSTVSSPDMIYLRSRLLKACKTKVGAGDEGDYGLIFDVFEQLIQAFKIRDLPASQQMAGSRLRSQLKSMLDSSKIHAAQFGGVARIIHDELSGAAGSAILRRVQKAFRDSVNSHSRQISNRQVTSHSPGVKQRFQAAAPSRENRPSNGGQGPFSRAFDPKIDKCFNCFQVGHMSRNCTNATFHDKK
jgi:hypothetical protein